jgi:hypothetical protein
MELELTACQGTWLRDSGLKAAESIRLYSGRSPSEDFGRALVTKFCAGVWLEDAEDFQSLRGRPVLFLANHQVSVESFLFVLAVSPLLAAVSIDSIAKVEHASGWLGQLLTRIYTYPGNRDVDNLLFVPLSDGRAMVDLLRTVASRIEGKGCALLVHVAGSRMLTCRDPVRNISRAFLDLALARRYPIVPLKFRGGLPVESLEGFIDFPVGYGSQDYLIGRSIAPDELAAVRQGDRRDFVLDRINGLGGPLACEQPNSPDPAFKAEVRALIERYHMLEPTFAVILAALRRLEEPSQEIAALLEGVDRGRLECAPTAAGQWLAGVARWITEGHLRVTVSR